MRPGSCFDGRHLYCERLRVWTSLLDPRWVGRCLADWKGSEGPVQLALFEEDEQ